MSRNKKSRASRRKAKPQRISSVEQCEQRVLLSGQPIGLPVASVDGAGNNLTNTEWGSSDEQLLRLVDSEYGDGISSLAGADRPSAREVSNAVSDQESPIENSRYLTDILWVWGQFIDHDIDLTVGASPTESAPIDVPLGDEYFDPFGTGMETISFSRSNYDPSTGDSVSDPREQINQITAFLDGSVVYGSDQVRADELRTMTGGKLKTSEGDLLPFNEDGLPNAGGTSSSLFLAGDIRANENVALIAMQTLWVREHNRLADDISKRDSNLSDEEIYQQAKAIVRAEMQAITYNEYLPALLGHGAISAYQGYDSSVNPGIANIFSTAAYRFGHSVLPEVLLRANPDGSVAEEGNIALRDAFFNPSEVLNNGIDSVLQGATLQKAQELDTQIVDEVRNFLFGPPGAGGFDLVSLNLQRGRDHGLPDYNQARRDLGLAPVASFSDISSDPEVAEALASVYSDVDQIDVWAGMLAEDHLIGSSVGELMSAVLVDQFTRLRDGDRFWYQNLFSGEQLAKLDHTSLADVIERNSDVSNLQKNVFYDKAVMYFEIPGNQQKEDFRVRVRKNRVEIVNNRTRQVVLSRPVDKVEQVMIAGRDFLTDRVIVEGNVTARALPGGVVAWGGHGGKDTFFVGGTRQKDRFDLFANKVVLNGNELINQGFENTTVDGMGGDDRLSAQGRHLGTTLRMSGGYGNDLIIGSAGHDRLFGRYGHDRIMGLGGNDRIIGGQGNDHLDGGSGHDLIQGNNGNDRLYGRDGNDRLYGGRGNDRLFGGLGRDLLNGGPGDDFLQQNPPQPPPVMPNRQPGNRRPGSNSRSGSQEELVQRFRPAPDSSSQQETEQVRKDGKAKKGPVQSPNSTSPDALRQLEQLGLSALDSLFTKT